MKSIFQHAICGSNPMPVPRGAMSRLRFLRCCFGFFAALPRLRTHPLVHRLGTTPAALPEPPTKALLSSPPGDLLVSALRTTPGAPPEPPTHTLLNSPPGDLRLNSPRQRPGALTTTPPGEPDCIFFCQGNGRNRVSTCTQCYTQVQKRDPTLTMRSILRRPAKASPGANTFRSPTTAPPGAPSPSPPQQNDPTPLCAQGGTLTDPGPARPLQTATPLASPGHFCPLCVADYNTGHVGKPRRRSRRPDGLCSQHAPEIGVSRQITNESRYCPRCALDVNTGRSTTARRRSRRSDGLCSHHAPKSNSCMLPRKRQLQKTTPRPLPPLPRSTTQYCRQCIRDFRCGLTTVPSRRSDQEGGLCVDHSKTTVNSTRKRRAPAAACTKRTRVRLNTKKPRRALYSHAYLKCIDENCSLRARIGSRCKGHHNNYLKGLSGMRVARYPLESHRDDIVPKHCLNKATAARFPERPPVRSLARCIMFLHTLREGYFEHSTAVGRLMGG